MPPSLGTSPTPPSFHLRLARLPFPSTSPPLHLSTSPLHLPSFSPHIPLTSPPSPPPRSAWDTYRSLHLKLTRVVVRVTDLQSAVPGVGAAPGAAPSAALAPSGAKRKVGGAAGAR